MPNLNPKPTPRIDYAAARVRLEAVTDGHDVLEGFDRMASNPDDDDAFLTATGKHGLSLDYIIFGTGKPFIGKAGAA
jgi:hypothetical protein